MLRLAQEAADRLAAAGWDVAVINPRFFKPLDRSVHEFYGRTADVVATLEDHVAMGGYGSAVLETLNEAGVHTPVVRLAWPDVFVEHASSVDYLRQRHGLTVERLVQDVLAQAGGSAACPSSVAAAV
jgi:1-deoxy-D-xylulose-5-phosphate synthase